MLRVRTCIAVLSTLAFAPTYMNGQTVPPTPNENDIPKPLPAKVGLAGSDRPDVSRFLNVRRAYSPSPSPDGNRLAFRTTISGKPQLWVSDAAGGWPRQLTFGESVTFHEWSPTEEWIVYGTDRGGDEREGFYLINPAGTRERELLPPSDAFREFGGFSPDGRSIVYATTERNGIDFDIHVIDVERGADREVLQGRMGLYAVSWRPDGGAVLLVEVRGEDANDVYLLDLASGQLDTLFVPDVASSYGSFSWKPDGSGFYLSTDQDRDMSGLAYYDVGERELTYLETPEFDVEQVELSHDGGWLAWTTNEGGYSVMRVKDAESGEMVWNRELPRGIYALDWAAAAPVASIYVSGPQIPGDIWTWDAFSGSLYRATESAAAGIDLEQLIVPEPMSFTARDGEVLHGLLYLPIDIVPGGKPPVLLAVHGGPTSQARPRFNPVHQYLLTRGIAIFDLNFRGSTGYGKRYSRLDNGRLRPNAVFDMADALDWLGEEAGEGAGIVDGSRAAVMGGSYGGYMTLAALTQLPDYFKGGVSTVGVSNWITALEGASPQLKASDRIEYGDIDDPDDRAFFVELSPITHVANVRAPLMVIHGANDPRDPVTESDQFVRAVREQGGEVLYLRFPDEGHGVRKLDNRITAYRQVAAFLEEILEMSVSSR
ncbi:MAG: S9 family peptidase [Candidatus Palauibacterales bacterium]|nr:S9 family peptidase [Candidatus Palauibacterales bacterium]